MIGGTNRSGRSINTGEGEATVWDGGGAPIGLGFVRVFEESIVAAVSERDANGNYFVSGLDNCRPMVGDLASGSIRRLDAAGPNNCGSGDAISVDGKLIGGNIEGLAWLWKTETPGDNYEHVLLTCRVNPLSCQDGILPFGYVLAISPDGDWIGGDHHAGLGGTISHQWATIWGSSPLTYVDLGGGYMVPTAPIRVVLGEGTVAALDDGVAGGSTSPYFNWNGGEAWLFFKGDAPEDGGVHTGKTVRLRDYLAIVGITPAQALLANFHFILDIHKRPQQGLSVIGFGTEGGEIRGYFLAFVKDTDGDNVPDFAETFTGAPGKTSALLFDTDGDGLSDGEEDRNKNGVWNAGETNPLSRDTDGDGFEDGIEARALASDPGDAASPLVGGNADYADGDRDALPAHWDPDDGNPDSDGDRFADGYERAQLGVGAAVSAAVRPPLGDLNGDGAVSNLDALVAQRYFLQLIDHRHGVFGGGRFVHADFTRDGRVSNLDALAAQMFFLEHSSAFVWPPLRP